jgi:pimeloyl-ACP methyl ester carboxylesterase
MAADVVAVLDALGVDRAHFFGYSQGAMVGFALAVYAPAADHQAGGVARVPSPATRQLRGGPGPPSAPLRSSSW